MNYAPNVLCTVHISIQVHVIYRCKGVAGNILGQGELCVHPLPHIVCDSPSSWLQQSLKSHLLLCTCKGRAYFVGSYTYLCIYVVALYVKLELHTFVSGEGEHFISKVLLLVVDGEISSELLTHFHLLFRSCMTN